VKRSPVKLLDWLSHPSADHGVSFAQDGGQWARISYRELAEQVRGVAALLSDLCPEDTTIPIVLPSGPRFIAAFFGSILAGRTPAPIAIPTAFNKPGAYETYLERLLSIASSPVVIADSVFEKLIFAAASPRRPSIILVDDLLPHILPADTPPVSPEDIGLLQFSSGSSGNNRGVRVPVASLEANSNGIRDWLRFDQDDAWATWLPVHHDMGLIAGIVTPAMHGMNVYAMPPERFIRDPLLWLRCFGELGATLSAVPNFGLEYVLRRVASPDIATMDFSRWKALVCGAERVAKGTLEDFGRLLEPAGFTKRSILPAYGLAESTLAVTGKPIGQATSTVKVSPNSLRLGEPVDFVADDDPGQWLVGCGRIVDPATALNVCHDTAPVSDGVVGEIVVSGSSVAAGYASASDASVSRFAGNTIFTGDAGFVYDGELFVIGRLGDSVKVRGRSVFAEDTDACIYAVPGLGSHNAVTLLGTLDDTEAVVAIVERPSGNWVGDVAEHLRAQCPSLRVVVISTNRGSVSRTTSGKPRRAAMWQDLLGRELIQQPVFDSAAQQDNRLAATAGPPEETKS